MNKVQLNLIYPDEVFLLRLYLISSHSSLRVLKKHPTMSALTFNKKSYPYLSTDPSIFFDQPEH